MKKQILVSALMISLLLCACASSTPTAPNHETLPHTCTYPCEVCALCCDANCVKEACSQKCPGHKETAYAFSGKCYITTDTTSVDTGTVVYDIGPNIFVPGNLEDTTQTIVPIIEQVSGLQFEGAGYARDTFPDGKVHVTVTRDMLYNEASGSEVGNAYATALDHAYVSPGDLLIGHSYATIHELSHVLMYRQTEWDHSQLLNEGFAEYTTYLVLSELAQSDPESAMYFNPAAQCLHNMTIDNYQELYDQPLEYWFDHTFEYSGNGNYSIGFRFMAYLQDVYGDYSKWIPAFEELYSFRIHGAAYSGMTTAEDQITVLKTAYGDGVLANFYPWLEENTARFDTYSLTDFANLHNAANLYWYPNFNEITASKTALKRLEYADLYIDLTGLRLYLQDYKSMDISSLQLKTSSPVLVYLYREDGSYTTAVTKSPVSLEGIQYIKLVGHGKVSTLEIIGAMQ